jgi:hypothetical protein
MSALPLCPRLGALDVLCDGADNRNDEFWIEPMNDRAQARFGLRARKAALLRGQAVDRTSAQIDQKTIQFAK